MNTMYSIIAVVLLGVVGADSFLAHDCSSPKVNVSVVDLENVEDCPRPEDYGKPETRIVQLVQARKYNMVEVSACLLKRTKQIKYCGMAHHSSEVFHGTRVSVVSLGREACKRIHDTSYFRYAGVTLGPIKRNDTVPAHVPVVGSYDTKGNCVTGTWASPEGVTYQNVVVTDDIVLEMKNVYLKVEVDNSRVVMPSGRAFALREGYAEDLVLGDVYWTPLTDTGCSSTAYDVLYEGDADFFAVPKINVQYAVVYSEAHLFAIKIGRAHPLCQHTAYMTEHQRLMVVERGPTGRFPFRNTNQSDMLSANADLVTMINTKAMFQELMTKRRMEELQRNALMERCRIERETLRSRLAIARASSDPVARLLQDKVGYQGVVVGNVMYLVACEPRRVQLRNASRCYQEIPILVDERPAFATPHSRVIVHVGQEVTCNTATPPVHLIDGQWLKFTPTPERTAEPARLRMSLGEGVDFPLLHGIGTAGIYPREIVEGLQESLQMAAERHALLTTMSRKAVGKDADDSGFQLSGIFTTKDLDAMAQGYLDRFVSSLKTMGSYSSIFVSLCIIVSLIKTIAEGIMYGRLLRGIASCWVVALASFWSGLASALVIRHERFVRERGLPDIDVELGTLGTDQPAASPPSPPPRLDSAETSDAAPPHRVRFNTSLPRRSEPLWYSESDLKR